MDRVSLHIQEQMVEDARLRFSDALGQLGGDPIKAAAAIHPMCSIDEVRRLSGIHGAGWREFLHYATQSHLNRIRNVIV